ncbi:MAG: sigma 54-interacting transcriptional regulator [Desulfarculaceae bacterium]|nr:sigma 54-interacting transcriptional regulator [Desulfarculaceae bacterium]
MHQPVYSYNENEFDLLRENQAFRKRIAELEEKLELSDLVFEHIENGALVTDPEGKIIRFNRPYADFMEVDPSDLIGRQVTEVIDNTRMHIVAQTGKPESMLIQRIKEKDLVVQRIPIKKNGQVMAVFGQIMFKDLREIHALAKTLELMESRVRLYEEELTALRRARYTLQSIKGTSQSMSRLRAEAEQAGGHSLPVLITGESGTGKEIFAQAIHNASHRRLHPFVRINCAAIPHDLFESELFGYAKGAFTGALSQGKPGKFELAGAGTLFLDEIGEMPLEMQPKLLQILEEKVYERVGGVKPMRTQCRIMAATNRNLENMMNEGSFRKDLFFRLNVVPIRLSPLRERRDDILPIARHLLEQIAQDFGQVRYTLAEEAAAILTAYDWPGNVRELHNVLERALSLMKGEHIKADSLPLYLRRQQHLPVVEDHWDLKALVRQTEKKVITEALASTDNNKALTARLLGIDRTVLYRKMKKYGIAG